MEVVSRVSRGFNSVFSWSFRQLDQAFNAFSERLRESGEEYALSTQDNTFYKPYYWKKVLHNTLEKDFLRIDKGEEAPYFIVEANGLFERSLEARIKRYRSFLEKCAEGEFYLDPGAVLNKICKYTKEKDPTFYAHALALIALPATKNQKLRISILHEIVSKIVLVELPKIPNLFAVLRNQLRGEEEKKWWDAQVKPLLTPTYYTQLEANPPRQKALTPVREVGRRLLSRSESKNSAAATASKTAIVGLFIFMLIPSVGGAFNATRFYQAARNWNYTKGPIDVAGELVAQNVCAPSPDFCSAPLGLIPDSVTNLTDFYWHKIAFTSHSGVRFERNIFNETVAELRGNFTVKGGRMTHSGWELYNQTRLAFDRAQLHRVNLNFHSGNISFNVKDSLMDRCSFSANNPDQPPFCDLEIEHGVITNSQFSIPDSGFRFSRIMLNCSLIELVEFGGEMDKISVIRYSSIQSSNFRAKINQGWINDSFITNCTVERSAKLHTHGMYADWIISNDGSFRESTFEKMHCLKLTRKLDSQEQQYVPDAIFNGIFKNIAQINFDFERARLYSPFFENVSLIEGEWLGGGVGSNMPPCNISHATLKAKNVVVNNFVFNRITGGCMFGKVTAAQARKWLQDSGVIVGLNVTFSGYDNDDPSMSPEEFILIGFALAISGSMVVFPIVCFNRCKRRRGYEDIQNPVDEESQQNPWRNDN